MFLKSNKEICANLLIICMLIALNINVSNAQQIMTLEQCRELALKNSEKVRNVGLSVEIAEQQKKEAFTKYFPNVSGSGLSFMADKPMVSVKMDMAAIMQPVVNAIAPTMMWLMQQGAPLDMQALQSAMQPQKIEALKNGIFTGIQATQPLFAGGQIVTANRLAKTGVEVKKLQKLIVEDEVLLATEQCFWQIVSLKEKMKTIENSDTLLNRILSDVRVAVSAGLTTRNDILRVELEQNRLQSSRLKVENGLAMLKMVLAQKIGLSPESFDIEIPDAETRLIASLPQKRRVASPQNRIEYKLMEKSVDVAKMQIKMERGKNLPTVAIGVGYNHMHFDMHRSSGIQNTHGLIFASVVVPIADWWGGSYSIKRKKLELQQAENTRRETAELLQQQMQNVQNELNEAYSQIVLAKKSIFSAEENLKISKDNYNAGITALSDLLEAQNLLQQTKDQYAEALAAYFVKLAEYRLVNKDGENYL
ncbi:MAG: TolC family protein [Prevotellaceae bacterium]|jgi:outer membrane protein TolC|nr:TolC family protein [Prevotellaceae bacterium]